MKGPYAFARWLFFGWRRRFRLRRYSLWCSHYRLGELFGGRCDGLQMRVCPFLFDCLLDTLTGPLARLRARGRKIAVLGPMQIRPRIERSYIVGSLVRVELPAALRHI